MKPRKKLRKGNLARSGPSWIASASAGLAAYRHHRSIPVSETLTAAAPEPSTGPATYTVPDIAQLAKASERHIWRLADAGKIPGRIRGLGRLVRFSRAAVDAWLAGRTEGRG
jgi:excisionase family DNA binding protein